MKLLGKICAATATSALLLTTVPATAPVAHAGISWGAAAGALLGGLLGQGAGNSNKSGNSSGGLFGGLSNQKHAHKNPTSEEKLFILAVEQNDFETVQQMLDAGVDINGVFPGDGMGILGLGRTAFSIALIQNNRDMMQFLLEHGADVRGWYNYRGDYRSYISDILRYHGGLVDISLLQYLLDWGTNINEYSVTHDGQKTYPIDHCTSSYYIDDPRCVTTTSFLLNHGAYVENKNQYGMTPFLRAVNRNDSLIMNLLADNGANINARDNQGRTASQIAIDNKKMDIYKEVQNIMAKGQQPSKYQELKANAQKKK